MASYRCASGTCGREVDFDTNRIGLACPHCQQKIFFKLRRVVPKTIPAQ